MDIRFKDRREAGQLLARELADYAWHRNLIVLALPRGGVPVGYEVAQALHAPLDVFIVRKLGVPGFEEVAMGAIASGGVRVLNDDVVRQLEIPDRIIDSVAMREQKELDRREHAYRGDRPRHNLQGRIVILVDDGLATGATMRAAVMAVRHHLPAMLVVAVPVAVPEVCEEFRHVADDIICLITPEPLWGVGVWYEDFSQTSDDEVQGLLNQAAAEFVSPPSRRAH